MPVDVIGALYDFTDGFDAPPERLWGFHVNICPEVLEANPYLQQWVFEPEELLRVWSGDDPEAPAQTIRLRFNGQAAAETALGDLWPTGAVPSAAPGQPNPK